MKIKKGFTLLEIVIALGIIAIMMLPLANSLLTSVKANKMAEIAQESKNISQEIIENLRTMGNVESCTMNIGKNNDEIKIEGSNGKYTVKGQSNGIEIIDGTIEKTQKGGSFEYSSDEYSKEIVGLVFYCYEDSRSSDKNKNNIIYSFEQTGKSIKEHIIKIEDFIKNYNSSTTYSNIGFLKDNNKIRFSFEDRKSDGSNVDLIINDTYTPPANTDGSAAIPIERYINIETNSNKVAFVIEDIRIGEDDTTLPEDIGKSPLIGLEVKNNRTGGNRPNLLFFNNRFKAASKTNKTNKDVEKGVIVDSFDEDKFIDKKMNVIDNIRYINSADIKNKGLYTIKLKTSKNNVKEETISEFIVSK